MKKFFLIPLLTLMCSVMAWATNVGTLQELKDALAAGGEITLTDNIDAGSTELVSAAESILDLNSFTLSGSQNNGNAGIIKVTGGSLVINATNGGGISAGTFVNGVCSLNAILVTGGSLTINAGTFVGSYEAIYGTGGTININDGSFTSSNDNAVWAKGATLNILGGSFDGSWYDVQSDAGSVTRISGGTFKGDNDGTIAVGCYTPGPDLIITGGTFQGTKGIGIWNGVPVIRGGIFKANPAKYVDLASYVVTKDASSMYVIGTPAAEVVAYNPNKLATYTSLTEAVDKASASDVIYVYKDDNTAVTLSKFITINANGHDIKLSAGEGYALSNNEGVYTINGVAVIGTTHYTSLAKAVEAASTGATITLWADASAATVSKTLIINANGFDASAATAGNGYSRAATNDGYVFGKASKSDNIYTVTNYEELFFAINAATAGDEVQFANDIAYPTTVVNGSTLNITKSITLNGQGHSLTGYGKRSNGTTCAIVVNDGEASTIDVVIKNITVEKGTNCPINVRSKVHSLTIENAVIDITNAIKNETYSQGLTIGGTAANVDPDYTLTITNTTINNGSKHYPIIIWVPVKELVISNSSIMGWSSLYFKPGSNGTQVTATNTTFDAINKYTGYSNTFGAFVLEDGGISIELNNCVVDATYTDPTGVAKQSMYLLSNWKELLENTSVDPCSMTIKGANSHIKGAFIDYGWTLNVPVTFDIQGGSYYQNDFETALATEWVNMDETKYVAEKISQGGEDIYRVHDKPAEKEAGVLYDLNDNVEEQGNGDNPATSFELSTGADMTLNQETTEAGYVQVKDNATEGATTITVAKNETNTDQSQKLVINNGLDVQGESQVIVEPTAALIIGEGGIVTSKPENIILKADEDGAATLLLDPAITINQNPNLTVTLKAQSKQLTASPWTYVFHRFAIPVKVGVKPTTDDAGKTLFTGETSFESYVFQWNGYSWVTSPSWTALKPFVGYQLANNSADGGITYTFTGELVGNDNSTYEFPTGGFDFFGNSHLAPIYIDSLLKPYMESNVEATVWLYNYSRKNFEPITADDIAEGFAFATEIKPMEGFILNLHAASGSATMDYASAIWGNPKFDAVLGRPSQKGAPARKSAGVAASNRAMVIVSAMNGMSDNVKLIEKETYSADFENGADASKFKFEEAINLYAETEAGELSRVATNDMKGTLLSFQSGDDTSYTLSLSNVLGEDYMLRDNVTGALVAFEEGATYTFMQDANTTVPARFEVVSAAKITTAIDSVEAEANASGIYSITGQFLGRDFTKLPAGVYVVNGVKIVK